MLRILLIVIACLVVLLLGVWQFTVRVGNPRVARELLENPDGERASKVMLLTLPDGERIPVNYLAQGDFVYAAADGRWWRQLQGDGAEIRVLVQGRKTVGLGRAVLDDPDYTKRIFRELRPRAIPGTGTLIEIKLPRSGSERSD